MLSEIRGKKQDSRSRLGVPGVSQESLGSPGSLSGVSRESRESLRSLSGVPGVSQESLGSPGSLSGVSRESRESLGSLGSHEICFFSPWHNVIREKSKIRSVLNFFSPILI